MIDTPIEVAGLEIPNRIVYPPVVVFWADESGRVTDRHVAHYARRARGGVGLIVVEATAVLPEGRLSEKQLGIWSDEFVPGLARIADAVHEHGTKIFIQIHHGGMKSPKTVAELPVAPSDYEDARTRARGLGVDEIAAIRDAFIAAARRAALAGFDGVELHGAHGYLLDQFASPRINLRSDEWGGSVEGRLRLAGEIISGIRSSIVPEAKRPFVVSCRMGCNEPDLEGGVAVAKWLEALGIDMLHVSAGMGGVESSHADEITAMIPAGFDHNWIVYGGVTIAHEVTVPVIAVNEITTPAEAEDVLRRGASFAAMARALLVDPDWPIKAKRGEAPVSCLRCKPRCHWFSNGEKCPRFDPEWLAARS
jgi:NADPH2 dehydrogenase